MLGLLFSLLVLWAMLHEFHMTSSILPFVVLVLACDTLSFFARLLTQLLVPANSMVVKQQRTQCRLKKAERTSKVNLKRPNQTEITFSLFGFAILFSALAEIREKKATQTNKQYRTRENTKINFPNVKFISNMSKRER